MSLIDLAIHHIETAINATLSYLLNTKNKQMKNIYIVALIFFLFTSFIQAQTGKIAGKVIDGEFNDPLAFANVLVKGTTTGVTSDFDGNYEIELEEGTYTLVFSFVGYNTQEISDIVVKAGEVVDLNVTLNANSLETVVITTTVERNTESAILNLQKKSTTLMDGLSIQAMKKTGAPDVAAAIKSVPGVSVQGGKYVYVRGLGDRYTKSILNGVDIPGLDPDRNTIPMDIFPTSIIDNVIVLKSASAEQPADFTGGIINVVTKDIPTKADYSISLGAGYNPDMHFNDNYLTYHGSEADWWGYDDGSRDLPINRYQPIYGTFENSQILTIMTSRFNKELKARNSTSFMNYNFGFTAGNQYSIGDNKLGYQAAFSYKNDTRFYKDNVDGTYSKIRNDASQYELVPSYGQTGSEGVNEVILSGLVGLTYKTNLSKYKVNVLHIQNGESTAGFYDQQIYESGAGAGFKPLVKDALLYTQRSVSNLLVNGNHQLGVSNWKLDWTFSPSLSQVFDKDHRITPLVVSEEGTYTISPSATTFPIQIWRWLQEENWVGKFDLENTYTLFKRPAKFKFGGGYVYKFRDFSIDDYTFTNTSFTVEGGDTNTLLAQENIWTPETQEGAYLVYGDQFDPNNAYKGEQDIASIYISNEFNVTENLKAILGLRGEQFFMYYTGQSSSAKYNHEKFIDTYDWYPSANLIYALTDNANLRASYSRTTARPSFKEKSTSQIFDPVTGRLFIGNTDVVPTYVNNLDLRYEWFRDNGQMIAISGFYKSFTDPIEITFFQSAPNQLTPANLGDADVLGAEFELRQNLGFIMEDLKDLKFITNVSVIDSKLTMSDAEYNNRVLAARVGENIKRKRELQGQSPYLINVGLDYSNNDIGLQTGLFFNVQGKTLEVVGTGIVPDVYTKPFNSLNFTLSKGFGEKKHSNVDLKVKNILGSEHKSAYESFKAQDQIYSLRIPGTEFSLGYTYKF